MSVTAAPKGIVATFRPFRGQGRQHIRASLAIDARGLRGGPSAIGAVSRAALWEITAIPDIRDQAALLAKRIIGADHSARVR